MSYKKSNYNPRQYCRRKSGWGRYAKATAPAVGFLAMKAAKIVASKYLNSEIKLYDGAITEDITAAGQVIPIVRIASGTTSGNRVGRSIKLTKVHIQGDIISNSMGDDTQTFRMIIFRDMDGNGTDTEPITAGGQDGLLASFNVNSYISITNRDRYQILYNKKFSWGDNAVGQVRSFDLHFTQNMKIEFNDDSESWTTASIGKGELYLFIMNNDDTENDATIKLQYRLRYIDN